MASTAPWLRALPLRLVDLRVQQEAAGTSQKDAGGGVGQGDGGFVVPGGPMVLGSCLKRLGQEGYELWEGRAGPAPILTAP